MPFGAFAVMCSVVGFAMNFDIAAPIVRPAGASPSEAGMPAPAAVTHSLRTASGVRPERFA